MKEYDSSRGPPPADRLLLTNPFVYRYIKKAGEPLGFVVHQRDNFVVMNDFSGFGNALVESFSMAFCPQGLIISKINGYSVSRSTNLKQFDKETVISISFQFPDTPLTIPEFSRGSKGYYQVPLRAYDYRREGSRVTIRFQKMEVDNLAVHFSQINSAVYISSILHSSPLYHSFMDGVVDPICHLEEINGQKVQSLLQIGELLSNYSGEITAVIQNRPKVDVSFYCKKHTSYIIFDPELPLEDGLQIPVTPTDPASEPAPLTAGSIIPFITVIPDKLTQKKMSKLQFDDDKQMQQIVYLSPKTHPSRPNSPAPGFFRLGESSSPGSSSSARIEVSSSVEEVKSDPESSDWTHVTEVLPITSIRPDVLSSVIRVQSKVRNFSVAGDPSQSMMNILPHTIGAYLFLLVAFLFLHADPFSRKLDIKIKRHTISTLGDTLQSDPSNVPSAVSIRDDSIVPVASEIPSLETMLESESRLSESSPGLLTTKQSSDTHSQRTGDMSSPMSHDHSGSKPSNTGRLKLSRLSIVTNASDHKTQPPTLFDSSIKQYAYQFVDEQPKTLPNHNKLPELPVSIVDQANLVVPIETPGSAPSVMSKSEQHSRQNERELPRNEHVPPPLEAKLVYSDELESREPKEATVETSSSSELPAIVKPFDKDSTSPQRQSEHSASLNYGSRSDYSLRPIPIPVGSDSYSRHKRAPSCSPTACKSGDESSDAQSQPTSPPLAPLALNSVDMSKFVSKEICDQLVEHNKLLSGQIEILRDQMSQEKKLNAEWKNQMKQLEREKTELTIFYERVTKESIQLQAEVGAKSKAVQSLQQELQLVRSQQSSQAELERLKGIISSLESRLAQSFDTIDQMKTRNSELLIEKESLVAHSLRTNPQNKSPTPSGTLVPLAFHSSMSGIGFKPSSSSSFQSLYSTNSSKTAAPSSGTGFVRPQEGRTVSASARPRSATTRTPAPLSDAPWTNSSGSVAYRSTGTGTEFPRHQPR